MRLSVELQLRNIAIVWHYLRDPTFSLFYTIPKCDRHTHTNRRTDKYTTTACTADREISVISTYLNDTAHTPLNRFVVYMLNKQVCNRHGDKTNRWSLGIHISMGGLKRHRCDQQSPSCAHLLIAARRVARTMDSNSTAVHTKNGSREQNHAPLGVICHSFAKT